MLSRRRAACMATFQMTPVTIPERLETGFRGRSDGAAWLDRLPGAIRGLAQRWSLTPGAPYGGASCSWVAPCTRRGTPAVLKVGWPHMEARDEIDGLLLWDGDPTVRVFEADRELNAMLLERCEPGAVLRERPEEEQDRVIAGLLRRLWRTEPGSHPFRPLSEMIAEWTRESEERAAHLPDAGLAREGLRIYQALLADSTGDVLLATDLHAGNVLRAQRQPWLVIDPKPFVGDPAYDATQHLLNCPGRLRSRPSPTIGPFSDLLGVDPERVRLWTFARLASDPWEPGHDSQVLARRVLSAW